MTAVTALESQVTANAQLSQDVADLTSRVQALEGARIQCDWNGEIFVSHGWDGSCAWNQGARLFCENGYVTRIRYVDCPGCSWNNYCKQ